jgi:uncharacterized protein YjbI with pentapeptide repeats
MDLPILNKTFFDTGNALREQENFQHFLFKDLNFKNRKEPISFFRSDFRGVKIENVQFYKNNFDRADFINSYITNTTFDNCFFGTDFLNVIFHKVEFRNNMEDTCSFHNCSFVDCAFESETVINTSNRNSTYSNCHFSNCNWEKNSFEDIHYIQTSFKNISFAEMCAYNLDFTGCNFENTSVDPDYLGSYLIKKTELKDLNYIYRGQGISLTGKIEADLETLSRFYFSNHRYYEAFNTVLLYSHYNKFKESISGFFERILHLITQDKHYLRRTEQLNRLIRILIFYSDSALIPSKDFYLIIGIMENFSIPFESINDKILYQNNLQLLKETVQTNIFELGIWDFDSVGITYAEIEIDEDDFALFKTNLAGFYDSLIEEYGITDFGTGYEILGTRKGSLIVEIAGVAVGIYGLATIAKSILAKVMEIKMEYLITHKNIELLVSDNFKDMKEWEKKVIIARKIQEKPSDELFKKAGPLIKLMKSFHIFPNAFFKGGNS